jgi:hypothetical protein
VENTGDYSPLEYFMFSLLSKILWINSSFVSPVASCKCEAWSLALRKDVTLGLGVHKRQDPKHMLVPERQEVSEEWRK